MNYLQSFIHYLRETFDTKNYHWVPSEVPWRTIAHFKYKYDYYVHLDEFSAHCYNLYFYRQDGSLMITDLIRQNDDATFKILANVKHIGADFLRFHPNLEFLGFSSTAAERDDLYTLFLQNLKSLGYKTCMSRTKTKKYYFLYSEGMDQLSLDFCIQKFTTEDQQLKK